MWAWLNCAVKGGWGCYRSKKKERMGGGASRREPEVHVVVVQSQENGKVDAKMLRHETYASLSKGKERRANRGKLT